MRRPRPAVPVLLTLASAVTLLLGGSAAADSAPGATVKLPVMPSRLAAGAACTGGSADVVSAVPWEQRSLQLARTWQSAAVTGAGVTVAVVDTGVSAQAPALAGRVTAVDGADEDCVGHGTFVAGLIAATPARDVRFAGVARQARILAVRGTDERGRATAATVARGIRAAVTAGAEVVAVSPALAQDSAPLRSAVVYAAAHDALIVAAAVPDVPAGPGAASAPLARDYWPAAAPGVLSVVDVDVDGRRPDGAYRPRSADLAAPGDGVLGIGPRGKGHFIGSGASLAVGYVAGAAALVRAAHPALTAEATAQRLTATAYPADTPRLDPYAALTTARAASAAPAASAPAATPVHLARDEDAARATRRALLLAGAGGGLVLLVAWVAVVIPRGRARGWRPARGETQGGEREAAEG
ncbi:S8 family serine peptidase [Streptomyces sp. NPDC002888]|uniref:S8 family serine peptidase n=1 Tax=Streptomyces sp. NPDC002888 TaxID=3364668 RepID=UPI00368C2C02